MKKHGLANTKLYHRWITIRSRCNNPNSKAYAGYGGRGIKVCEEWEKSFMSFYEWSISNGYKDGLTIDRIDNNKGYSPDNCRWVTTAQQNRNTRRNHMITYQGKTQCIADWATETGLSFYAIFYRLSIGLPLNKVFETGNKRCKMLTYHGETKCLKEWAKKIGVHYNTIQNRVNAGLPIDEVLYPGNLQRK